MHIQPRSKSPIFLLPTSSNHTLSFISEPEEWQNGYWFSFYCRIIWVVFFPYSMKLTYHYYTGHVFLLINYSNIWWIKSVSIVNKLETHDNHELQYQIQIIPSSHLTQLIFSLPVHFLIFIHQRLTITNPKLFLAMYW